MPALDDRDDASRRLLDLEERELRRILLDLHDGPVQYLYAALSQVELLRRALDPAAAERIERVRVLLESGLGEIRSIIGARRPPAFESCGLRELVEGLVLQHESTTDTRVTLACDPELPEVDVAAKVAVYRVAQEALSNAYRHGAAPRVVVRVGTTWREAARWLTLDVSDDGAGFDPAAVTGTHHVGLAGMRDRAHMLGGTMAVHSAPGRGATITLAVPIR